MKNWTMDAIARNMSGKGAEVKEKPSVQQTQRIEAVEPDEDSTPNMERQRAFLVLDKFVRGDLSEIIIWEEHTSDVIVRFREKWFYKIDIEPYTPKQ